MEKLLNLHGLETFYHEKVEPKADPDGAYESMTVGNAEQLVSTIYTEDNAPYNFRTAGGSADIGNRETDMIIGGTIAWNQLVDTSTTSVTLISGHKFIYYKNSTWSIATGSGNTLSVTGGTDMVFDITQMFGTTIANYIYALGSTNCVAWFRNYFPKTNYEYNAGELMSVNVSEHNTVGFNAYDNATGTAQLVGGMQYQISGTYTSISYEDISGNSETLTPNSSGLFTPTNSGTLTVVGGNGTDTCVHLVWSGYRNGEYEEYEKHTYGLDSSLELRGIPKLDSSNNLYYDGDTYEADGTVIRKYGIVDLGTLTWQPNGAIIDGTQYAAQIADKAYGKTNMSNCKGYTIHESSIDIGTFRGRPNSTIVSFNSTAEDAATFKSAMSGIYLVYELATPTTETAEPFVENQIVDDFGTEEYVDYAESQGDRDVAIPVGHVTQYLANLRDKLQHLPDLAEADGDYIIRQSNNQMVLVESSEADLLEDMQILKDLDGYSTDILGLQVDFQSKTCRRLGAAVGKSAGADFNSFNMYGGRKDCIVTDGGVILAYYGDTGYTETGALEVAITKDGTTYPIGTLVQVMTYKPKFYYKMVPITLEKQSDGLGYHVRKANYYISDTPKQGFKLFPVFYDDNGDEVEYVLEGAYEGSIYDVTNSVYVTDDSSAMNATSSAADTSGNKFSSIAGVKPASGLNQYLTRPNMEILANNRGAGWHMQNAKFAMIDVWLQMIEYGTPNSQGGAGSNGVVSISDQSSYNCSADTGSTASLGNGSGQAASTTFNIGGTTTTQTTNGKTSYRYRGMENPWGNIWKHIIGVNIWGDGTLKGGVPFICDDFNYAESKRTGNYKSAGFTVPNAGNYVTALGYGNEEFDWLLMASETGASANSLINDYTYVTANLNAFRIARLGGSWLSGADAGSLAWRLTYGVGARARDIGSRLVYVPKSKTPSVV